MKLLAALAVLALGASAQAADVECNLVDGQGVKQLRLNDAHTELEQIDPRAFIAGILKVKNISVEGTTATITGLELNPNIACAGSCGPTTFVLKMSAQEIAPNSTFTKTNDYFDESRGGSRITTTEGRYSCSYKNLENTSEQPDDQPTLPVDPTADTSKGPVITKVIQYGNLMPSSSPVGREIDTTVRVQYSSCASHDGAFEIESLKSKKGTVLLVNVKPNTADCPSRAIVRVTELLVPGLPVLQKVRVLKNGRLTEVDVEGHFVY
jgi:hypothetical protein